MDRDERVEALLKVHSKPGLCSREEIEDAYEWLEDFNILLKIYKEAYGEPIGLSVDSRLDKLRFYLS